MSTALEIRDLHVNVAEKEIIKGLDLTVQQGEIHAMMGPNGAGKSTLAHALMGHPAFEVTQGRILFKGEDIIELGPDERSRMGLFLAFQYPVAIPGVSVANFLRMAINSRRAEDDGISVKDFRALLKQKMDLLKIPHEFAGRHLNDGFSGGEKKRAEILQLATLEPQIAVLDETDSGLDIDAVRIVADGVNSLVGENLGVLIITHYQRILNYINPDRVHVLVDGRIIESGGPELAESLEELGYEGMLEQ